jgi:hypothetical protein
MSRFMLAALLCILLGACHDEKTPMRHENATIEKVLGFSLPGYASACHFHSESAMGLFAYLKCELPSERLQDFLQTSPLLPDAVEDTAEPTPFASYNRGAPWWNPSELAAPRYGVRRGQRGTWKTSSYLAADPRQDRTIVYFLYMEEP